MANVPHTMALSQSYNISSADLKFLNKDEYVYQAGPNLIIANMTTRTSSMIPIEAGFQMTCYEVCPREEMIIVALFGFAHTQIRFYRHLSSDAADTYNTNTDIQWAELAAATSSSISSSSPLILVNGRTLTAPCQQYLAQPAHAFTPDAFAPLLSAHASVIHTLLYPSPRPITSLQLSPCARVIVALADGRSHVPTTAHHGHTYTDPAARAPSLLFFPLGLPALPVHTAVNAPYVPPTCQSSSSSSPLLNTPTLISAATALTGVLTYSLVQPYVLPLADLASARGGGGALSGSSADVTACVDARALSLCVHPGSNQLAHPQQPSIISNSAAMGEPVSSAGGSVDDSGAVGRLALGAGVFEVTLCAPAAITVVRANLATCLDAHPVDARSTSVAGVVLPDDITAGTSLEGSLNLHPTGPPAFPGAAPTLLAHSLAHTHLHSLLPAGTAGTQTWSAALYCVAHHARTTRPEGAGPAQLPETETVAGDVEQGDAGAGAGMGVGVGSTQVGESPRGLVTTALPWRVVAAAMARTGQWQLLFPEVAPLPPRAVVPVSAWSKQLRNEGGRTAREGDEDAREDGFNEGSVVSVFGLLASEVEEHAWGWAGPVDDTPTDAASAHTLSDAAAPSIVASVAESYAGVRASADGDSDSDVETEKPTAEAPSLHPLADKTPSRSRHASAGFRPVSSAAASATSTPATSRVLASGLLQHALGEAKTHGVLAADTFFELGACVSTRLVETLACNYPHHTLVGNATPATKTSRVASSAIGVAAGSSSASVSRTPAANTRGNSSPRRSFAPRCAQDELAALLASFPPPREAHNGCVDTASLHTGAVRSHDGLARRPAQPLLSFTQCCYIACPPSAQPLPPRTPDTAPGLGSGGKMSSASADGGVYAGVPVAVAPAPATLLACTSTGRLLALFARDEVCELQERYTALTHAAPETHARDVALSVGVGVGSRSSGAAADDGQWRSRATSSLASRLPPAVLSVAPSPLAAAAAPIEDLLADAAVFLHSRPVLHRVKPLVLALPLVFPRGLNAALPIVAAVPGLAGASSAPTVHSLLVLASAQSLYALDTLALLAWARLHAEAVCARMHAAMLCRLRAHTHAVTSTAVPQSAVRELPAASAVSTTAADARIASKSTHTSETSSSVLALLPPLHGDNASSVADASASRTLTHTSSPPSLMPLATRTPRTPSSPRLSHAAQRGRRVDAYRHYTAHGWYAMRAHAPFPCGHKNARPLLLLGHAALPSLILRHTLDSFGAASASCLAHPHTHAAPVIALASPHAYRAPATDAAHARASAEDARLGGVEAAVGVLALSLAGDLVHVLVALRGDERVPAEEEAVGPFSPSSSPSPSPTTTASGLAASMPPPHSPSSAPALHAMLADIVARTRTHVPRRALAYCIDGLAPTTALLAKTPMYSSPSLARVYTQLLAPFSMPLTIARPTQALPLGASPLLLTVQLASEADRALCQLWLHQHPYMPVAQTEVHPDYQRLCQPHAWAQLRAHTHSRTRVDPCAPELVDEEVEVESAECSCGRAMRVAPDMDAGADATLAVAIPDLRAQLRSVCTDVGATLQPTRCGLHSPPLTRARHDLDRFRAPCLPGLPFARDYAPGGHTSLCGVYGALGIQSSPAATTASSGSVDRGFNTATGGSAGDGTGAGAGTVCTSSGTARSTASAPELASFGTLLARVPAYTLTLAHAQSKQVLATYALPFMLVDPSHASQSLSAPAFVLDAPTHATASPCGTLAFVAMASGALHVFAIQSDSDDGAAAGEDGASRRNAPRALGGGLGMPAALSTNLDRNSFALPTFPVTRTCIRPVFSQRLFTASPLGGGDCAETYCNLIAHVTRTHSAAPALACLCGGLCDAQEFRTLLSPAPALSLLLPPVVTAMRHSPCGTYLAVLHAGRSVVALLTRKLMPAGPSHAPAVTFALAALLPVLPHTTLLEWITFPSPAGALPALSLFAADNIGRVLVIDAPALVLPPASALTSPLVPASLLPPLPLPPHLFTYSLATLPVAPTAISADPSSAPYARSFLAACADGALARYALADAPDMARAAMHGATTPVFSLGGRLSTAPHATFPIPTWTASPTAHADTRTLALLLSLARPRSATPLPASTSLCACFPVLTYASAIATAHVPVTQVQVQQLAHTVLPVALPVSLTLAPNAATLVLAAADGTVLLLASHDWSLTHTLAPRSAASLLASARALARAQRQHSNVCFGLGLGGKPRMLLLPHLLAALPMPTPAFSFNSHALFLCLTDALMQFNIAPFAAAATTRAQVRALAASPLTSAWLPHATIAPLAYVLALGPLPTLLAGGDDANAPASAEAVLLAAHVVDPAVARATPSVNPLRATIPLFPRSHIPTAAVGDAAAMDALLAALPHLPWPLRLSLAADSPSSSHAALTAALATLHARAQALHRRNEQLPVTDRLSPAALCVDEHAYRDCRARTQQEAAARRQRLRSDLLRLSLVRWRLLCGAAGGAWGMLHGARAVVARAQALTGPISPRARLGSVAGLGRAGKRQSQVWLGVSAGASRVLLSATDRRALSWWHACERFLATGWAIAHTHMSHPALASALNSAYLLREDVEAETGGPSAAAISVAGCGTAAVNAAPTDAEDADVLYACDVPLSTLTPAAIPVLTLATAFKQHPLVNPYLVPQLAPPRPACPPVQPLALARDHVLADVAHARVPHAAGGAAPLEPLRVPGCRSRLTRGQVWSRVGCLAKVNACERLWYEARSTNHAATATAMGATALLPSTMAVGDANGACVGSVCEAALRAIVGAEADLPGVAPPRLSDACAANEAAICAVRVDVDNQLSDLWQKHSKDTHPSINLAALLAASDAGAEKDKLDRKHASESGAPGAALGGVLAALGGGAGMGGARDSGFRQEMEEAEETDKALQREWELVFQLPTLPEAVVQTDNAGDKPDAARAASLNEEAPNVSTVADIASAPIPGADSGYWTQLGAGLSLLLPPRAPTSPYARVTRRVLGALQDKCVRARFNLELRAARLAREECAAWLQDASRRAGTLLSACAAALVICLRNQALLSSLVAQQHRAAANTHTGAGGQTGIGARAVAQTRRHLSVVSSADLRTGSAQPVPAAATSEQSDTAGGAGAGLSANVVASRAVALNLCACGKVEGCICRPLTAPLGSVLAVCLQLWRLLGCFPLLAHELETRSNDSTDVVTVQASASANTDVYLRGLSRMMGGHVGARRSVCTPPVPMWASAYAAHVPQRFADTHDKESKPTSFSAVDSLPAVGGIATLQVECGPLGASLVHRAMDALVQAASASASGANAPLSVSRALSALVQSLAVGSGAIGGDSASGSAIVTRTGTTDAAVDAQLASAVSGAVSVVWGSLRHVLDLAAAPQPLTRTSASATGPAVAREVLALPVLVAAAEPHPELGVAWKPVLAAVEGEVRAMVCGAEAQLEALWRQVCVVCGALDDLTTNLARERVRVLAGRHERRLLECVADADAIAVDGLMGVCARVERVRGELQTSAAASARAQVALEDASRMSARSCELQRWALRAGEKAARAEVAGLDGAVASLGIGAVMTPSRTHTAAGVHPRAPLCVVELEAAHAQVTVTAPSPAQASAPHSHRLSSMRGDSALADAAATSCTLWSTAADACSLWRIIAGDGPLSAPALSMRLEQCLRAPYTSPTCPPAVAVCIDSRTYYFPWPLAVTPNPRTRPGVGAAATAQAGVSETLASGAALWQGIDAVLAYSRAHPDKPLSSVLSAVLPAHPLLQALLMPAQKGKPFALPTALPSIGSLDAATRDMAALPAFLVNVDWSALAQPLFTVHLPLAAPTSEAAALSLLSLQASLSQLVPAPAVLAVHVAALYRQQRALTAASLRHAHSAWTDALARLSRRRWVLKHTRARVEWYVHALDGALSSAFPRSQETEGLAQSGTVMVSLPSSRSCGCVRVCVCGLVRALSLARVDVCVLVSVRRGQDEREGLGLAHVSSVDAAHNPSSPASPSPTMLSVWPTLPLEPHRLLLTSRAPVVALNRLLAAQHVAWKQWQQQRQQWLRARDASRAECAQVVRALAETQECTQKLLLVRVTRALQNVVREGGVVEQEETARASALRQLTNAEERAQATQARQRAVARELAERTRRMVAENERLQQVYARCVAQTRQTLAVAGADVSAQRRETHAQQTIAVLRSRWAQNQQTLAALHRTREDMALQTPRVRMIAVESSSLKKTPSLTSLSASGSARSLSSSALGVQAGANAPSDALVQNLGTRSLVKQPSIKMLAFTPSRGQHTPRSNAQVRAPTHAQEHTLSPAHKQPRAVGGAMVTPRRPLPLHTQSASVLPALLPALREPRAAKDERASNDPIAQDLGISGRALQSSLSAPALQHK